MEREHQPISEALTASPTVENTANPKLGEAVSLLERGLEAVQSDEGFGRYLKVMSRFHEYSWINTLLILTQYPEATRVAGYRKWQEMGRQVVKGEQGIRIYYPMFGFVEQVDPVTGEINRERQLTGYGIGNVFDVSQTKGEPLPDKPRPYENVDVTEASADLNRRLGRFLTDGEGVRCESKPIGGDAKGYYKGYTTPKEIVIRQDEIAPLSVIKTKTLAHEAAHHLAGHSPLDDRQEAELVAEASAFVVLNHYGFDTTEYSSFYLAAWQADKDKLRKGLKQIQQVSQTMIRGIEGIVDPIAEDPFGLSSETPINGKDAN